MIATAALVAALAIAAPAKTDTFPPPLLEGDHEPTATYGSFPAAREALQTLLRRTLGVCADSAQWKRGTTSFRYRDQLQLERRVDGGYFWWVEERDHPDLVPSLKIHLVTTSDRCPGSEIFERMFESAGWVNNGHFSADGPDGTLFSFYSREALCVVEMSWQGEDDSDSTYVPPPGYTFDLTCVPRPRQHPAPRVAPPKNAGR